MSPNPKMQLTSTDRNSREPTPLPANGALEPYNDAVVEEEIHKVISEPALTRDNPNREERSACKH